MILSSVCLGVWVAFFCFFFCWRLQGLWVLGSALLWVSFTFLLLYGHDESDFSMHSNSFDDNHQVHTHSLSVPLE